MKKNERLLWIGLFLVLTAVLVFQYTVKTVKAGDSNKAQQELILFSQVYQKILNEYVDKQKPDDLIHNAIDGMIKGLGDPHSALLKPKSYDNLKTETSGKYGGLGIVVGIRDNKLTVVSPMEDTPAEKVGIEAGDKIVKIEGTNAIGISLENAVNKLRGLAGTKVHISVEREDEPNLLEFDITREIIKIKSVKTSTIQSNVGYVRITSFSKNTPEQLKKSLQKILNKKIEYLIVDLRNNPGGLLSAALEISDMFLDNGPIVSTKGRIPMNDHVYNASPNLVVPKNIPMIVMVNQGSASASEIFSGAMQDTKRAVLLGSQSYGKGSVQTVLNLDNNYGLRLTIARYYTPANRMIDKKGLKPDIVIEPEKLTKKEIKSIIRLNKTNIIKNFVKEHPNYTKKELKNLQKKLQKTDINLPDSIIEARIRYRKTKKSAIYDLANDNQLREAVQILKSQSIFSEYDKK